MGSPRTSAVTPKDTTHSALTAMDALHGGSTTCAMKDSALASTLKIYSPQPGQPSSKWFSKALGGHSDASDGHDDLEAESDVTVV